jgi:hypothetical protein
MATSTHQEAARGAVTLVVMAAVALLAVKLVLYVLGIAVSILGYLLVAAAVAALLYLLWSWLFGNPD